MAHSRGMNAVNYSEIADKLFENQVKLMKQPVCRNGKQLATVGMQEKIWETWK